MLIAVLALAITSNASDQLPAKPQDAPILLTGAEIHTLTGPVLKNAQLLFDNGKITAVAQEISTPPSNARRIDLAGKRIYPGLFAAGNDLGLTEIRSVPGSVDLAEVGTINPNVRAEVAVNPDSELIPVARANGILLNLTVPAGGTLTGSSAVLQLDGWTWADMTLKAPVAIHLTWPSMGPSRASRRPQSTPDQSEQPSAREEALKAIDQTFDDARAYMTARKASKESTRRLDTDARWESMIPLLEGKIPLIVRADDLRQINAAIAFAVRQKVKLIISGGYDAPLAAELLKKHDVPVIVNGIHRLPLRPDSPYDEPFTLPSRLRQAGVRYCISQAGRFQATDVRNLPYQAATAAAFGLPPDEALKAITLYPAQILNVSDRVGSLEEGKDATLIVTSGDILETPTQVELAFIQGRQLDLTSKHTQLNEKYREKYRRHRNGGKTVAGD